MKYFGLRLRLAEIMNSSNEKYSKYEAGVGGGTFWSFELLYVCSITKVMCFFPTCCIINDKDLTFLYL